MIRRLIILFCCTAFFSCGKKSEKMVITDFSEPIRDTLVPLDNPLIPYGIAICKMEGHTNDTISISFLGTERKYVNEFSDELKLEYYGEIPVVFEFNPLNATAGKIKVEYQIE